MLSVLDIQSIKSCISMIFQLTSNMLGPYLFAFEEKANCGEMNDVDGNLRRTKHARQLQIQLQKSLHSPLNY